MIVFTFHKTPEPSFFDALKPWLKRVSEALFNTIGEVQYIFCTDNFLLGVNKKQLSHDYYTDIITFDLRDKPADPLVCDIYISLDRVKENALSFNCTFAEELKRVMVHGLLHLAGMNDSTEEEKQAMRLAENKYINLN